MVLIPGIRHPSAVVQPHLYHMWWALGPELLCVFLNRLLPGHGQEDRFCPGSSAMPWAGTWRLCLSGKGMLSLFPCPTPLSQWLFGGPSYLNHRSILTWCWRLVLGLLSIPNSCIGVTKSCYEQGRINQLLPKETKQQIYTHLLHRESPFMLK